MLIGRPLSPWRLKRKWGRHQMSDGPTVFEPTCSPCGGVLRLPVTFLQFGLGIERIDLAGAAVHEQEHSPLCLGSEVRLFRGGRYFASWTTGFFSAARAVPAKNPSRLKRSISANPANPPPASTGIRGAYSAGRVLGVKRHRGATWRRLRRAACRMSKTQRLMNAEIQRPKCGEDFSLAVRAFISLDNRISPVGLDSTVGSCDTDHFDLGE